MYITKVVSHEIGGQSSALPHTSTFSVHELDIFYHYHTHNDNTKCLLLAHCVHKYVFGSLQHIKCFTTPRTPTLSHTLFSHAPCVTPHPMTGCLAVIQFSRWVDRPHFTRFCSLLAPLACLGHASVRQQACTSSLFVSMVNFDSLYF